MFLSYIGAYKCIVVGWSSNITEYNRSTTYGIGYPNLMRADQADEDDDEHRTPLRQPELVSPQRENRVSIAARDTSAACTEMCRSLHLLSSSQTTLSPFPVYGLIMDRACRSRPLRLNVRLVIGERFGGLVPSPERARLHPDSYLVFVSRTITTRSRHVIGIRKAGKRYIGQCREVFYHLPA